MHETIFKPLTLGGVTLKNRIIFAPTTFGLPAPEYEAKLEAIASGGCAMIIIGDVPVGKRGFHSLFQKKGFAYYEHLCQIVHRQGSLVCAQLHQSDLNIISMLPYLPALMTKRISGDDLRNIMNQKVGPYITGLPAEKVSSITASFGDAARLAKKAGFDMIQIHGDRMCGSFSSSLLNKRTDCYGKDTLGRTRFAVEAVRAVRQALPDVSIDYKLAVRREAPDFGRAGVLEEELSIFVPELERAGVTSFHVALANHGDLNDTIPPANHPFFKEEGCFLPFCDQVRQFTDLPLTGVGGLHTPDYIEDQLSSQRIDCAAMSRQLIADPFWPEKVQFSKESEIRHCTRCNKDCLGGIKAHRGVHCIFDKEDKES